MRKSYLVITLLLLSLFGAPYIVSGNDLPEFSSRSTSLESGALSASEGSSSISYVEQQENVVQETPKLITQQSNGLQLSEAAFDPPRIEKEATGPNYYGDSLSTTGTATDNRDVEYPGITVYLFLDNPVGDIIDAVDNSITDSNGDYTLNFPAFTTADLGTHSWSVWYPNQDAGDPEFGIDCFNCNKTVANGSFSLFDEIDFDVLFANTVDLSPADNLEFTSSVELSNTDPLPPAVLSNFSISYDIDYQDPSLTDVVDATASFTTASIVETIPYPGTSEATATITVDIVGSATNYVINAPTQYSGVFNIITEFTFTIGNIDISGETGTPFTKTQLEGDQFFSRTNQLVTLSGTYISTSLGANASHWNNVPVQVSISGSGLTDSSLDSSGLATNASGIFVYSFSIDPTKFNDPGPNGAISITIQIFETFDNLLPAEEVKTLTIKLKAEADVFNNVQYTGDLNGSSYTPLYYFRGDGSSFQITGEVLDEQGLGARGVRIDLFVTNQTAINQAGTVVSLFDTTTVGGRTAMGITVAELTTNSSGQFDINFILPDIGLFQRYFTVNLTISDPAITNAYRWENIDNDVESVFSFEYMRLEDIDASTVTVEVYNGTLFELDTTVESFSLFNNTYAQYQNASLGYYYNITIRDIYGRIPYNVTFSLDIDELFGSIISNSTAVNTTSYTIDLVNNGSFLFYVNNITQFGMLTSLSQNPMLLDGSQFKYQFRIGQGQGFNVSSATYGQLISIFGPNEETVPSNLFSNEEFGANQETEANITIQFEIDLSAIGDQIGFMENVRNVTIYFRVNDTGNINDTEIAGFDWNTLAFQSDFMFYEGIILDSARFTYSFLFSNYGHGTWFQYYIVVYDLAGHGRDVNGNLLGGNQWTAGSPDFNSSLNYAGYNSELTNAALITGIDAITPVLLKMGDTVIPAIADPDNDIRINGQPAGNGITIDNVQENITITVILPSDPNNYSVVFLNYRFLTNTTAGGLILDTYNVSEPYIIVNMFSVINTTGSQTFRFIITAGQFTFGQALDFFIFYNDTIGNEFKTESFFAPDGTPKPGVELNQVLDIDPPVSEVGDNNFNTLDLPNKVHPPRTVVIWSNETISNYTLSYLIQDINGTGLFSITVSWFVNGSTTANLTEIFVLNGIINGTILSAGDSILLNFTIPVQYFEINTTISWEIEAVDASGNIAIFNAQDDNPNQFEIRQAPIEVTETTTSDPDVTQITSEVIIVTTDENGQNITITSQVIVDVPVEEPNNALWIIAGFLAILGLLTLWYQRHNIAEYLRRRQRRKRVEGTLSELTDEIRRLGTEGRYRRAILLVWEALERVSREILQNPRRFNQTAREFAAYLSTVTIVDRDTLLTLSSTFESARYGKNEPSKDEFEDAVKALDITVRTIIESGARSRIADDDEDW